MILFKNGNNMNKDRNIATIAFDIRDNWKNVNYAAKPYLEAMYYLETINDMYFHDNAKSIILYFLNNASSFRGDKAKALKLELRKIANIK